LPANRGLLAVLAFSLFIGCGGDDAVSKAPERATSPATTTAAVSTPAGPANLVLQPSQIAVQGLVTGRGSNFTPSSQVTILAGALDGPGAPLGTVSTDPSGSFEVQTVLPIAVPPGSYKITALDASGRTAYAELTVTAR
jgi:hypothetical protein